MDEYSSNCNEDLFLLLIVGLFLAEILVGAIQLFGALIRTVICINKSQPLGKLKTYWIMVGTYFIVFFSLYFLEDYLLNNICIDNAMEMHLDDIRIYQYALYTHIIWVFLAWGIAIWYWIKIVFVKRKSTTEINNSLTQ
jgi:hypothetical protein